DLPAGRRRDPIQPPAPALLEDPVRARCLDDGRLHPYMPLRDSHPRGRPDAVGLQTLEPILGDEVIGEGGAVREVTEQVEDALAWRVDRPLDRDRAHGAAILCASCGQQSSKLRTFWVGKHASPEA